MFDGADEIRNDLALVSPLILSTPSRSLPRTLKRRKEEANQGAYDCDDDEKLDQGESTCFGKGSIAGKRRRKAHRETLDTTQRFSKEQWDEFVSWHPAGPTSKFAKPHGKTLFPSTLGPAPPARSACSSGRSGRLTLRHHLLAVKYAPHPNGYCSGCRSLSPRRNGLCEH